MTTELKLPARPACTGRGDLFHGPEDETGEARLKREAQAKDVCASCLVAAACLQFALDNDERHGVWGGLNDIERYLLLVSRGDKQLRTRCRKQHDLTQPDASRWVGRVLTCKQCERDAENERRRNRRNAA